MQDLKKAVTINGRTVHDKANDLDLIMELVQNDEYEGICIACGEVADGCEPDAEKYKCEACGEEAVYGAEQLLIYLA